MVVYVDQESLPGSMINVRMVLQARPTEKKLSCRLEKSHLAIEELALLVDQWSLILPNRVRERLGRWCNESKLCTTIASHSVLEALQSH